MAATRLARNTAPKSSTDLSLMRLVWAMVLGSVLLAGQALGQDNPLKVTAVDAPRGEVSDSYRDMARARGVQTEATYASDLQGKLPTDGKFTPPAAPRPLDGPVVNGPLGLVLVLVALLGGLALWLRFGGAGTLLAAGPGDLKPKSMAPEGWKLPDTTLPSGDIFALIRSMADRRAAMVLLLRASLMRAAEISDTRFARSDTEREALRRLPQHLHARPVLADLLQQAELAHYGGREVAPETLAALIDRARPIFGAKA